MSDRNQNRRPESAWVDTERYSLGINDPPATSSSEIDINALIKAIETFQKMDLLTLRRLLNSNDSKYLHSGQHASPRYAWNDDWSTKYMDLKAKYDKLKNEIEEKKKLEDKLKDSEDQLKNMEQKSLEQSKELVLLQQRAKYDDEKLQKYMKELELKSKKLETQAKEMEELRKAKDDTLTRLSRLMGQKMSDGNPNITDLSDRNRPTKLGEIYSELYDNEWTETFEVLTEIFYVDDASAIALLLKILVESYKHASDKTQLTMKKIEELLSGSSKGVSPDCKRLLSEARKLVDIKKADDFLQDFQEKLAFLERRYLREQKVICYVNSCFQLCWMMSIQDPPVVLSRDPLRGDKFDTNLYKPYMHTGDKVDYIVWPALLLYKDGPLLAKGVAEPYTILTVKSTHNVRPEEKDSSVGRRRQIEHDGKKQASTYESDGMYWTPYGYEVSYSTESAYKKTMTQTFSPESDYSKPRTQKFSPESDSSKTGTQKFSPESDYSKTRTQKFSPESDYSRIMMQKHPTSESKVRDHSATSTVPNEIPKSQRTQFYQDEKERFKKFYEDLMYNDNVNLRRKYGSDYERYLLLLKQMKGHK